VLLNLVSLLSVILYSFFVSFLLLETEEISETLAFSSTSRQLIAQQDLSTCICCESFKTYVNISDLMKKVYFKITELY
jgi:hypothetical protein